MADCIVGLPTLHPAPPQVNVASTGASKAELIGVCSVTQSWAWGRCHEIKRRLLRGTDMPEVVAVPHFSWCGPQYVFPHHVSLLTMYNCLYRAKINTRVCRLSYSNVCNRVYHEINRKNCGVAFSSNGGPVSYTHLTLPTNREV